MAWNHSYIFVKGGASADIPAVLSQLNLAGYKSDQEVSLLDANKPETLFAGIYRDSLLLVHPDLPFTFFGPGPSEEEKLFIQTFPQAEIAALIINETVNLFGYAVIVNGQKIRMKDGCDGTIYHDVGEPLPEELATARDSIFMTEDLEEMKEMGMSDEEIAGMEQFEISYRIPNQLTKRYLGEPVVEMDTDKVRLMRYTKG